MALRAVYDIRFAIIQTRHRRVATTNVIRG